MPTPGPDTYIVDELQAGQSSTATDTMFLLSTSTHAPATPTVATRADTEDDALNAKLRSYFTDKGKSVVLQGYSGSLPTLDAALDLLPKGQPGQVVAPEAVLSADLIKIANASWASNKVALLNGPGNATDSALTTLAGAVIAGADGRGSALFADVAQYTRTGASADNVPWTITAAALIAANDIATGNPNFAAAGKRGISKAASVTDLRSDARRTTLDAAQINTAKLVVDRGGYSTLRSYGFRTLADLEALPHWWDLSGSRTVMAFRARAAAVDEEVVFDQIDGFGIALGRYESLLRAECKDLWERGALHGKTADDAYRVVVQNDEVNPLEDLAAGEVKANVYLKVSPYANHVSTTIIRRAITAPVGS